MKKFDYKCRQPAATNHLEIINLHGLGIALLNLLHFACKLTIFILGVGRFWFGKTKEGGGFL